MDQQSLTGKLQIRALDIQVMYSLLHTCALVSSISRIIYCSVNFPLKNEYKCKFKIYLFLSEVFLKLFLIKSDHRDCPALVVFSAYSSRQWRPSGIV